MPRGHTPDHADEHARDVLAELSIDIAAHRAQQATPKVLRWADLVLVAPATADFMARLAHGQAPDLLSTLCLATEAPVVIAPLEKNHVPPRARTRNWLSAVEAKLASVASAQTKLPRL